MSKGRAIAIALLLTTAAGSAAGSPAEQAECIRHEVAFDGNAPLHYASVTGAVGSRAYMHAQIPTNCPQESCKGAAYILSGDVVAVAKTCGKWAYTQYLGATRVTVGWTSSSRLRPVVANDPNSSTSATTDYDFELTQGRGVPVCEAYLQRLNQTQFSEPPYCNRPESTTVPGFSLLHRKSLPRSDFIRLFIPVESFLQNRSVVNFYVHHKRSDGTDVFEAPTEDFYPADFEPSIWTYDPRVDIDNDGQPDNVAIWSELDRKHYHCVEYIGNSASPARFLQSGVVLKPDSDDIDATATQAIFGHPIKGVLPYRDIGSEVGVFQYRGLTYFDTFFTDTEGGDFRGQRKNDRVLQDTLGVFLHKDGHTRQICEYRVSDQGD